MPAVNFNQPIFQASAGAATDWNSVEGKAESEFTAGAALKRGLRAEVGLSALVELDAALSKFIAAQVMADASAQARVTAQIQLPLNLFEEAGAAVRLQAVAEAAAGVQAGLGLSVGDFVEAAQLLLGTAEGVPMRLMLLFLEEIDLAAGVHAKVSASAQAQAYASIVATLRNDPVRGLKPGFNIVAGAGLGLAAGAGVRLYARAGFRDFPRFYARAVDLAIDAVFDEAVLRFGTAAGPALAAALDVARPPFKTAFRLAYDVGEFLATANPPQNAQGAAMLAARASAVMFEEGQRHLLRKLAAAGTRELRRLLAPRLAALDAAGQARVRPRREALIAVLRARPQDPFDTSIPATQDFWIRFIGESAGLTAELFAATSPSNDIRRALTVAWCAVQLLLVAAKRATRAEASLSVLGRPPQQAHAAFQGSLAAPPPSPVADELASALGISAPTGGWQLEHAVSYLTTGGAITLLETVAPEAKPYLDAFRGTFGATSAAVAKTILGNLGAVPPAGGGAADAQQTLRNLVQVLRTLIEQVVDAQAMPAARTALAQSPQSLLYLEDVLRPGLGFALGSCTDLLLNWSSGTVSPSVATETLSGVVLKLLGRTLVVTADVIQDYVQHETQAVLEHVAADVGTNGLAARFATIARLPADVAAERAADVLRLMARTLAPYTEAERREMRELFFAALDPIPPAAGREFIDELARDSFVPNAEAAGRLLQRTFDLISERFVAFALGMLELLGETFLNLIQDALQAATEAIEDWIREATRALQEAERRLGELGLEILKAGDNAAAAMDQALGELAAAFGALGAAGRRSAVKNRLADSFVDKLEDVLDDNEIYRQIPRDVRNGARDMARAAVRDLANGLAAPVFDAIASVGEDVADLLEDIRELDPSTGLASGVADLVLDRVEGAVRQAFGGDDPGFNASFEFTYSLPEVRLAPPGVVMRTHRVHVGLGRLELPISTFIAIIRDVVSKTSVFESAIDRAAVKLRSWLEHELEAMAKTEERDGVAAGADRLRLDKAAAQGSPRDLWLASPSHGGVYRDLVQVRVVLDDATADFADFVRGPERFFVHLNGVELPAGRFTIETRQILQDRLDIRPGTDRRDGLPSPSGMSGRFLATASPASTARAPNPGAGPSALTTRPRTPSSNWSAAAVIHARGTRREASSLAGAFAPGVRMRGVKHGSAAAGGSSLGRIRGEVFGKPGSRLREIDFSRALDSSPRTTIVLRAELGLDECDAGMNALSATVLAADGSRLTRTATFIVEAPTTRTPGVGGTQPGTKIVFPPRRDPVDAERLKPKPVRAPLGPAARKKLGSAAKNAIVGRKSKPAARIAAASAVLKERLRAKGQAESTSKKYEPDSPALK
jgi:hypothetical protein